LIRQIAALPYRRSGKSKELVEILLITSRDTGRWVLPKGNPIFGLSSRRAAALEAEEEAGVRGTVAKKSLGQFPYRKWIDSTTFVIAEVEVFALKVRKQLAKYKEQGERERRWIARGEAATMVDEPELRAILLAAALP
jgi:uncharacterized protein